MADEAKIEENGLNDVMYDFGGSETELKCSSDFEMSDFEDEDAFKMQNNVSSIDSRPVALARMQTIYTEDSDMTHEDLTAFVRKALNENAFFKPIVENQTLVHHVVDHIKPRTVKPGTEIIRQGEVGNEFYMVKYGIVEVFVPGIGKVAERPDMDCCSFGEMALLYDKARNANCVAKTECQLWVLDRTDFKEMLDLMKKEHRIEFNLCLRYQKEKKTYGNSDIDSPSEIPMEITISSESRILRSSFQGRMRNVSNALDPDIRRGVERSIQARSQFRLNVSELEHPEPELEKLTCIKKIGNYFRSIANPILHRHPILYSIVAFFKLAVQFSLVIADSVTDIVVLSTFWTKEEYEYFILTLIFLLVPSISCWAMSFQLIESATRKSKWYHGPLLFLYVFPATGVPIHFMADILESIFQVFKMIKKLYDGRIFREEYENPKRNAFVRFRSLVTACGESLPQAILLLAFAYKSGEDGLTPDLAVSLLVSLCNLIYHVYSIHTNAKYHGYDFTTYFVRVLSIAEIAVPKHPPRLGGVLKNEIEEMNWANYRFEGQSSDALLSAINQEGKEGSKLNKIILSTLSLEKVSASSQGILLTTLIDKGLDVVLTGYGRIIDVQNAFDKVDVDHSQIIEEYEFLQLANNWAEGVVKGGKWLNFIHGKIRDRLKSDFDKLRNRTSPEESIRFMDLENCLLRDMGALDIKFGKVNMIVRVLEEYVMRCCGETAYSLHEHDLVSGGLGNKADEFDLRMLMERLIVQFNHAERDEVPSFLDCEEINGETALSAFVHFAGIAQEKKQKYVVKKLLGWLKNLVTNMMSNASFELKRDTMIIYRLWCLREKHPGLVVKLSETLEGVRFVDCCYESFAQEKLGPNASEEWAAAILRCIGDTKVFDFDKNGKGQNLLMAMLEADREGHHTKLDVELIMSSMSKVTGDFNKDHDEALKHHMKNVLASKKHDPTFNEYIIDLIQNLDFDECEVNSLSDSICQLVSIESLFIREKQLCELPRNIGKLVNLTKLYITECKLTSLPDSIVELTSLKNLHLNGNRLKKIPSRIGKLSKLKSLHLNNNKIEALPHEIGQLLRLQRLYVDGNDLTFLPSSIGRLMNLKMLHLNKNHIKILPDAICELRNLTHLKVNDNLMNTLPENIGQLAELELLDVKRCGIQSLPDSICNLEKLESLDINYHEMEMLPEAFGKLENLRVLDLFNGNLEKLPNSICNLRNLNRIDIAHNELIELPKSMGNLMNLVTLNVKYNNLKTLPISLLKCGKLKQAQIVGNKISVLPDEFKLRPKIWGQIDVGGEALPGAGLQRAQTQPSITGELFRNLVDSFDGPIPSPQRAQTSHISSFQDSLDSLKSEDDELPVATSEFDFEIFASKLPEYVKAYRGSWSFAVFDMSGFTKMTRAYGAVHFTSLIIRNWQISFPILQHFSAEKIVTEADNIIAMFREPLDCFKASCVMMQTLRDYNKSLPEHMQHFKVVIGGCGMAYGECVCFNEELHSFSGSVYDHAFDLGENLCEKNQIFVSDAFYQKIKPELGNQMQESFGDIATKKYGQENPEIIHSFRLNGLEEFCKSNISEYPFPIAECDDGTNIETALLAFTDRHNFNHKDWKNMDDDIYRSHVKKNQSVLLFELQTDDLHNEIEFFHFVKSILINTSGVIENKHLIMFEDSNEAYDTTIRMKEYCEEHEIDVSGFGLDVGDIIVLDGHKIEIGDCINTASKIGEDLGENGEINITQRFLDSMKEEFSDDLEEYLMHREGNISGLTFHYFTVIDVGNQENVEE